MLETTAHEFVDYGSRLTELCTWRKLWSSSSFKGIQNTMNLSGKAVQKKIIAELWDKGNRDKQKKKGYKWNKRWNDGHGCPRIPIIWNRDHETKYVHLIVKYNFLSRRSNRQIGKWKCTHGSGFGRTMERSFLHSRMKEFRNSEKDFCIRNSVWTNNSPQKKSNSSSGCFDALPGKGQLNDDKD